MSARVSWGVPSRGASRSAQRRKVVNVDLNVPAAEIHDEEISSVPSASNVVTNTQGLPPQPVPIDVDLIDDDDVIISSARAFAEAKFKSRWNKRQMTIDANAEASSTGTNNRNKRHRVPGNQQVINCEGFVILDCEAHNSRGHNVRHKDPTPPPPPPPPPKEPAITCPICMSALDEEVTTKCGHIFCKGCINSALAVNKKCPTCRRKMTMKDTIRIYLPTKN